MTEQLLLFKDNDIEIMERRIKKMEESIIKMQKSQYGKIGKNCKDIIELKAIIEVLVRNICNGNSLVELRSKYDYEVTF